MNYDFIFENWPEIADILADWYELELTDQYEVKKAFLKLPVNNKLEIYNLFNY